MTGNANSKRNEIGTPNSNADVSPVSVTANATIKTRLIAAPMETIQRAIPEIDADLTLSARLRCDIKLRMGHTVKQDKNAATHNPSRTK